MNKRLDVLICGGGACISSHSHDFKKKLLRGDRGEGPDRRGQRRGNRLHGPVRARPGDGRLSRRFLLHQPEGSETPIEIVDEHFLKGRPVAGAAVAWLPRRARSSSRRSRCRSSRSR
ncbi:MAG: hypothetical protein MZW92_16960 [Comamonadaceae bacterium]|nr:hypothetical protein [Comamonadaceae bacterium]